MTASNAPHPNLMDHFTSPASHVLPILELGILALSLFIVTTTTIGHILQAYRLQTLVLGFTALAALAQNWAQFKQPLPGSEELFVLALLVWPLFLRWMIGPALSRATISEDKWRLSDEDWMEIHRAWAEASFRQGKPSLSRMGLSMVAHLLLVVFAFVVAFRFIPQPETPDARIGLGVALALQFAGLFTLISKREIISQVIGLFVMDHGMYLGMTLLAPMPTPAGHFLIALYLYTFITLLLLFFLLPNLRRIKKSIELDRVQRESQLKG